MATRFLIVEDDPGVARGMLRLARAWGYDVRLAADGPSAVAALGDWRPCAALVDLGLPGMSGFQVAQWVREQGLRILLVATTGWTEHEERNVLAAGFDHFLPKPVTAKQLRAVLPPLGADRLQGD